MPADLMRAIQHASRVNGWFSNLQLDEQPPEWMWSFEDELTEWFEQVEQKRKEKFGQVDNDSGADEVPMMSNELARDRR